MGRVSLRSERKDFLLSGQFVLSYVFVFADYGTGEFERPWVEALAVVF